MMEIFVKDLQFVGHHGTTKEEQEEGSLFIVDAIVEYDESVPARQPDLDAELILTLDYCEIADVIMRHAHGPSVMLVETLAKRMVNDIFYLSLQVLSVDLTIRKKAKGVPGNPGWVGVRMLLDRHTQECRRNIGATQWLRNL